MNATTIFLLQRHEMKIKLPVLLRHCTETAVVLWASLHQKLLLLLWLPLQLRVLLLLPIGSRWLLDRPHTRALRFLKRENLQ